MPDHSLAAEMLLVCCRPAVGATSVTSRDGEWDELELPYGHGMGAWLAEFGPDVLVLEPADLRADVIERLRGVAKG